MTPANASTDPSKGSAKISLHQSADPRRVLADRVEQLYSQLPLGIVATFVISVVAAYELREGRYVEIVLFWAGLVLLLTVARAGLYWSYRRNAGKVDSAQWLRWLAISALANGATWGFAGAVFFPSHADEQQVFLAFLLAGMVAGGVPMYAVSWPVYALYAAGIVFPFTYVLATFGNKLFAEIALLVPAFYAINVGIAYRLNEVFDSGYRLRHAYGKLTEDYTALNQRLEQQLVELEGARRQVEASGRKLALFAERSPIAVFEFDADGNVLSVNPAAENLFGFTASEMVARPGTAFMFPGEMESQVASRGQSFIAERKPVFGLRYNNIRRDGSEVICEWNLTPLVNPDNQVVSVIIQGRDITQQLEAERIKQEFTSTLSHELRTPLTSIIGSLQLINSGVMGDIEKDTLELTTIAERNGQRLLDLINDILDVEKIESGKLTLNPEVLELGELVAESLTLNRGYAERFKVKLAAVAAPEHVKVNADRKRVHQIMTNLLSNAVKFSPEGSVVEVTMEYVDGSTLRVSVHDKGPGIPEDFRNRIFGRFAQADMSHTRQKGGTGLGLAICKRLVELMGGRIGFSDRDGGGTTFWFELPKHD
ncbi:MAG: PAS domain-containing sensor histidine kinase [Candidatus Parcubacteria bacterium]|nr:PAS domain-containing sensor histidine kinase [Burkholderiales bacterium]